MKTLKETQFSHGGPNNTLFGVPSVRKDISVEDGHRCDCELIAKPPTQAVSSNWPDPDNSLNWSMQVEVSENDGLVVRDVKLGQRYMAEKMGELLHSGAKTV